MDLKTALNNTRKIYPRLPTEEFEYIRQHKEEAIPHLLKRLQIAVELDYTGNIEYTIFPLAEFREHKALPYLLEILRLDEDDLEWLLGDTLTEGYESVVASCALVEDIPEIKKIVSDDSLYEFARLSALSALNIMFAEGIIEREKLVAFYGEIFKKFNDDNSFMQSVIDFCADLHFDEFIDKIKPYFDENKFGINETWDGWQEALAETTRENAAKKFKENRWGCYIDNCIDIMSWWWVFKDKSQYEWDVKIPVNAPCPCGSGKKFKKCCKE